MQGLAEFAGKAYGSNADFRSSQLSGSLTMGNYYNHTFAIAKDNKLTLQTVELPSKIIPGKLQVSGQGVGCALIQVKLSLKSSVTLCLRNKEIFQARKSGKIICGSMSIFSTT